MDRPPGRAGSRPPDRLHDGLPGPDRARRGHHRTAHGYVAGRLRESRQRRAGNAPARRRGSGSAPRCLRHVAPAEVQRRRQPATAGDRRHTPAARSVHGANLAQANFRSADVRGADLEETIIDDTAFEGALADETTWWPPGFDPGSAGVRDDG
ncbi:pentapeptide repeat-containing protein [Amycolatopsis sp. MEPSY49]|uniref:pentapeptide repeat-containing protein n=1 Tax=Amycolatopsis sp. MEPSY49 TaxID=3151600 RepID=UPI003EF8D0CB